MVRNSFFKANFDLFNKINFRKHKALLSFHRSKIEKNSGLSAKNTYVENDLEYESALTQGESCLISQKKKYSDHALTSFRIFFPSKHIANVLRLDTDIAYNNCII